MGLPQLLRLDLRNVADHRDVACLGFLEAPNSLGIHRWPGLRNVSDLVQWADTLTYVALAECPAIDLAPVRELTMLRKLNLWDTGDERGVDLSPLAEMTDLKIIVAPDQEVRGADLLGPGSSVTVTG